ncbi:MAG TPA: type I-E CRISPR-associated protein Cas5/CasD [Syntrophorhabdaceae bacterium]|nr:type I-E CRISPR-associated protein Cas5/CasD [Syntrophorhabdaceae bacterium]
MQSWGTHTYEDYRPSNLFPTRSGLVGLLAGCLGIERSDHASLRSLAQGIDITVRVDQKPWRPEQAENNHHGRKTPLKLTDYHTVLKARRANRDPKEGETIETRREYLFDESFTVAVAEKGDHPYSLDTIAAHLKKPVYTPFLGRRSCPIAHPLFFDEWLEAVNGKEALEATPVIGGTIYAESIEVANNQRLLMRDVPEHRRYRSFATRIVFIHSKSKEVTESVSEPN